MTDGKRSFGQCGIKKDDRCWLTDCVMAVHKAYANRQCSREYKYMAGNVEAGTLNIKR